jgi:hypothetical protein
LALSILGKRLLHDGLTLAQRRCRLVIGRLVTGVITVRLTRLMNLTIKIGVDRRWAGIIIILRRRYDFILGIFNERSLP